MTHSSGLKALAPRAVHEVLESARSQGLQAYRLSTPAGCGVADFFAQVRSVMPLDPPVTTDNWDALNDSLCAGIADINAPGIVVAWPDASNLRTAAPREFEVAMTFLARVADEVGNPHWTDSPKSMSVYVDLDPGEYGNVPYNFLVHGTDLAEGQSKPPPHSGSPMS